MPRDKGQKKKVEKNLNNSRNSGGRKRNRSVTPSSYKENVNKDLKEGEKLNSNRNATASVEQNVNKRSKRDKRGGKTETVAAKLIKDEQFIEMKVGQDTEFNSKDSDDESNVVILNRSKNHENSSEKGPMESEIEEEEDREFDELLHHNYEMAGLSEKEPEAIIEEVEPVDQNKEKKLIINQAVDKFQEVFMKSSFMETTAKMQKQLLESQKKIAEQSKEIEKLEKLRRSEQDRGKGKINPESSFRRKTEKTC